MLLLELRQEFDDDLVRVIEDLDHDVVFPEALVPEFLDPLFALDDEGLLACVEVRVFQRILYEFCLACLQKTGKQVYGHFLSHYATPNSSLTSASFIWAPMTHSMPVAAAGPLRTLISPGV